MKRITIALMAVITLSMSVSAHASQSTENEQKANMGASGVPSDVVETTIENAFPENDDITVQIAEIEQTDAHKPGKYDDKYYADYKGWCENYEYFVKSYLGEIVNPADPSGKRCGIKPERTEPWWDEWIAEMLSEGLIEQAWYDEMVAKGYIIEVD